MLKKLYGPMLYPKADRMSTYAAALAYCFVLSLVPFLAVTFVVGLEVSSYLALSKHYAEHYAEVLGDIIPGQNKTDSERIFSAIQHSTKGGLLTVGFILAVYTSYNLMEQIIRTLIFIFDDPRKQQEWTWASTAKTFLLLLIWMCLLLLISISAVETAILQHLLDSIVMTALSKALATATQVLIVIGALLGTFYLTYLLVPAKSYQKNVILEGSLLAATGWIAVSMVFAFVMPKILQSSASFIALGSVVAILLWAQACAWSIIVGACWIVRFSPASRGK